MQMLVCQRCGAPVHWDGASRVAACGHCGTEYLVHPQARGGVDADGIGRDEVAVIPIGAGAHAGRAYARSFIPKGWTAVAADPELSASIDSPMTMRVRISADDGRAVISRTGCVCYEHIDDVPANAGRQWQLEMPGCKRVASYRDASAVCDMAVAGNGDAAYSLLTHEADEDSVVRGLVDKMRSNVAAGPASEWDYSYCRRTYRVTCPDGSERLRLVEGLVDYVGIPPNAVEMQLYQQAQSIIGRHNPLAGLGSLLGLGGLGGLGGGMPGIEAPAMRYAWEIVFLFDMEARPDAFEEAREICKLVRASYEESPEFERTQVPSGQQFTPGQQQGRNPLQW